MEGRADEHGVCFICAADAPALWAVSECGHCVCVLCALRMRLLYGSRACLLCKRDAAPTLVCGAAQMAQLAADREAFAGAYARAQRGDDATLRFVNADVKRDAMAQTECRCPVPGCGDAMRVLPNADALRTHVRAAHGRELCALCVSHRRVFPLEQRTYARAELAAHVRGDDGRGRERRLRHGHPACAVCGALQYGADELREHLRARHEACALCVRAAVASGAPQDAVLLGGGHHYRDVDALAAHLSACHHVCGAPGCAELRLVAFADALELRAHVLEVHGAPADGRPMQRAEANRMRRLPVGYTVGASGGSGGGASASSPPGRYGTGGDGRSGTGGNGRSATGGHGRSATGADGRHGTGGTQRPNGSAAGSERLVSSETNAISALSEADAQRLFFGGGAAAALRPEARAQYVQRNESLSAALATDYGLGASDASRLRAACAEFQAGARPASGLVAVLGDALGGDAARLSALCAALCDLQLDAGRAAALARASAQFVRRDASFPALPPPDADAQPGRGARPVGHTVIRVRSARQTSASAGVAGDPTRNPLTLLGGSLSASGGRASATARKKQPAHGGGPAASFVHAAAASSGVPVVVSRSTVAAAPPARDPAAFPALGGGETAHGAASGHTVFQPSSSVLAGAPDHAASETFDVASPESEQSTAQQAQTRKPKGGRQTLLRYG